jgi:zinc protease
MSGIPTVNHNINDLKNAFLAQVHQLQTQPVSKQELQRIKAQVIAQNVYSKDSLMAQAMDLGIPVVVGLPWQTSDNFVKKVTAVTAAEIQAVAKKYLTPQRLTVAILKPKN